MGLLLALGALGWLAFLLFCLISGVLVLTILIQKGRGGGLGAAFGGGASSLLGTKTGDFLTWVTISLVAGFLVLSVLMGKFMRPTISTSSLAATTLPAAGQSATEDVDEAVVDVESTDGTTDVTVEETTEAVVPETDQPADAAPADTGSEQPTENPGETTE